MARLLQLILLCVAVAGVHMEQTKQERPGETIDNFNIHDIMDSGTGRPLWPKEPPIWINSLDSLHKYGLPENTVVGSYVGTLRAWSRAMYPLTYSTNSDVFDVEAESGDVLLVKELDREAQSSITVSFTASYDDEHEIVVTHTVPVKDVNDNAPVFLDLEEEGGYAVEIHQGILAQTVVFSGVRVFDADEGDNSNVELTCYHDENLTGSTEACEIFGIAYKGWSGDGYQQGFIYTKGELTEDSYQMVIVAQDRGRPSLSSNVTVLMVVYSPGHTLPRFVNMPSTISIKENIDNGSIVGQLIAMDHSDSPGPLSFSISDSSDPNRFFLSLDDAVENGGEYTAHLIVNATVDRDLLPVDTRELTPTHHEYFCIAKVTKDGTEPSVELFIPIHVVDENDEIPVFTPAAITVSVPENIAENEAVPDMEITVNDADLPPANIYRLRLAGNGASIFRLSPTMVAGRAPLSLRVVEPENLDYENPDKQIYHLQVYAEERDGDRSSVASIEIQVADANDNSPQFSREQYEVHAQDSMPVGTTLAQIQASDADEDGNALLSYSLVGDSDDRFAVNPYDGTLVVASDLRGADSKYHLTLKATDVGGNVGETSVVLIISFGTPKTAGVDITLVDNGSSPPVFQGASFYETFVDEGSVVLSPTIRIVPSNTESSFVYSITEGNFDDTFMVSPSGYLVLTRPLDRYDTPDNLGYYQLTIQASTTTIPASSAYITVKINVRDTNNHAPVFEQAQYTTTLSELTPPGSSVLTVRATDKDYGINASISYSIIPSDAFVINSATGLIQVASSRGDLTIDTAAGSVYNMMVYAKDGGNPSLTGSTQVVVTIADVNNQYPVFTQSIYVRALSQAPAADTMVVMVAARDADSNSNLHYTIRTDTFQARDSQGQPLSASTTFSYVNAFAVGLTSGQVLTTMPLASVEDVSEVSFQVMVNDTNAQIPALQQTAMATVRVLFLPESAQGLSFSEPWSFDQPYLNFALPETTEVGTELVPSLIAINNGGQTAESYLKLEGTDPIGYFTAVETEQGVGHVYLNKAVDYDTMGDNKQLTFQVMATLESRTSYATIRVNVTDTNDNEPVFLQTEYTYSIREDARFPTSLGTIVATDQDSGAFSTIVYSLTGNGHEAFTIHPTNGELSVAEGATLNAEVMPIYNLFVRARDNPYGGNNQPSKEVWAKLTINVEDVNDNAPAFTSITYNVLMTDNTPAGTYVLTVTATDADVLNGALTYTITEGNDNNMFLLVPSNGSLWTQRSLAGYWRVEPYVMTVSVMDDAGMTGQAQVKVYVSDAGSTGPSSIRFIDPPTDNYAIQVDEEQPIGTPVANVFANDPTSPGVVVYQLSPTGDSNKFNIDRNTGLITNQVVLDAEQQMTYSLVVGASFASNPLQSATLVLTVTLNDLDDNDPSFYECEQPLVDNPIRVYAKENQPPGQPIVTITACDADQPPFNAIYYHLVCGNDPSYATGGVRPFSITQDGALSAAITFDREIQYSYVLCVKATSDINFLPPSLSANDTSVQNDPSILRVLVTIQDEDDNPPTFGMPNATFYGSVMAEAPFHSQVIQITSYDPDRNSVLFYSLSQLRFHGFDDSVSSTPGAFVIDQQTGMIFSNRVHYLPYTDGYFSMNVLVSSSPSQAQTSSSLVIYVVRSAQMMKLIFNREPEYLVNNQNSITNILGNILGVVMQVDGIRYHALENGIIEYGQTDLCFHMIKNTKIVEPAAVFAMFEDDRYQPELGEAFDDFKIVDDVGKCTVKFTTIWWSGYWYLWWLLITLALLIFILALIIIICLCCCYSKAKRKLPKVKPYTMLDPYVIPYEYEEATVRM